MLKPWTRCAVSRVTMLLVLLCWPASTVISSSSSDSDGTQVVTFDHARTPSGTASHPLNLAHGERFTVVIKATDPDKFDYELTGIVIATPVTAAAASPKTKTLEGEHHRKYAGYWVRATKKNPGVTTPLSDAIWLVSVETVSWNTEIAGGFTISWLTNPEFEIRDVQGSNTVFRNRDAEDEVTPGLGAFIHLYHEKHDWIAGTFGLGISQESDTTYYTGLSYRFGGKGAFTAGWSWGPVDRLPSGVREGDVVTEPNVLNTLASRTDGAFFVAYSYTFLDVGSVLKKPFASSAAQKEK